MDPREGDPSRWFNPRRIYRGTSPGTGWPAGGVITPWVVFRATAVTSGFFGGPVSLVQKTRSNLPLRLFHNLAPATVAPGRPGSYEQICQPVSAVRFAVRFLVNTSMLMLPIFPSRLK
jgi:hypothetical protein